MFGYSKEAVRVKVKVCIVQNILLASLGKCFKIAKIVTENTRPNLVSYHELSQGTLLLEYCYFYLFILEM